MGRKGADQGSQRLAPAVNIALLGELNVYVVHEHELDRIAEGSPATLAFNGAIALLSMGVAFLLTVTTTTIQRQWLFDVYLFVSINFLLVGSVLLVYWWRTRSSVRRIVQSIKSRMRSQPGIQESMPPDPLPATPPNLT